MNLEFSLQIFEKYSNMELNENPCSGSQVVHADGRTDRHFSHTFHPHSVYVFLMITTRLLPQTALVCWFVF